MPQEVCTRSRVRSNSWRAPGSGLNSGYSSFHSRSLRWMTFAAPYSRRIIGGPSKAQNIRVMRGFCWIWAEVSLPLPVRFSQAIRVLSRMTRESMPFGETFTRLSAVAVPTKNSLCWPMNLMCASDSWKNFWLKGRSRLPGWLTSIGARPGAEPFRLPRIDARRSMALPFRPRVPQWRRWEMCRRKFDFATSTAGSFCAEGSGCPWKPRNGWLDPTAPSTCMPV